MHKKIQWFFKRTFDYSFAFLLLFILWPVMVIAMIVVKVASPEEAIIFTQMRPGYKGALFKIYKLRTMTNEKDENGHPLPHDDRIKVWGKIIRKSNVDELFQLFNILKGDMSFIGPRPVLPVDVEQFNAYQMQRQDILPGITGWSGINELEVTNWERKFDYDIYYVNNFNLLLDAYIFIRTVYIVLFGLRPDEKYRPTRFMGNRSNQESKEL